MLEISLSGSEDRRRRELEISLSGSEDLRRRGLDASTEDTTTSGDATSSFWTGRRLGLIKQAVLSALLERALEMVAAGIITEDISTFPTPRVSHAVADGNLDPRFARKPAPDPP